jgi:hypothetical protein
LYSEEPYGVVGFVGRESRMDVEMFNVGAHLRTCIIRVIKFSDMKSENFLCINNNCQMLIKATAVHVALAVIHTKRFERAYLGFFNLSIYM